MTAKSLLELRTTGFKPLRDGRIHVRCPQCGRKQSNAPRDELDPPAATLVEIPCPNCGAGCKIDEGDYYDVRGREVSPGEPCEECGEWVVPGIRHDCDAAEEPTP